jgi:hypothetical protein
VIPALDPQFVIEVEGRELCTVRARNLTAALMLAIREWPGIGAIARPWKEPDAPVLRGRRGDDLSR